MKILKVDSDNLERAWPHASKWIAKANLRGNSCYPLEDMKRDISDGKRLLLRCVAGPSFCWLVVGCVENSQNRTAIVYACGGDGVLDMLDDIVTFCEAYAAANKCQYITCSGRSGWVKALGRYGWNELGRTCGKELAI